MTITKSKQKLCFLSHLVQRSLNLKKGKPVELWRSQHLLGLSDSSLIILHQRLESGSHFHCRKYLPCTHFSRFFLMLFL